MDMQVSAEAAALITILTAGARDMQALRIDLRAESASLQMTLADEPNPADTVIGVRGALVYLHPDAAERLQSRTLDASRPGEKPAFYLR